MPRSAELLLELEKTYLNLSFVWLLSIAQWNLKCINMCCLLFLSKEMEPKPPQTSFCFPCTNVFVKQLPSCGIKELKPFKKEKNIGRRCFIELLRSAALSKRQVQPTAVATCHAISARLVFCHVTTHLFSQAGTFLNHSLRLDKEVRN